MAKAKTKAKPLFNVSIDKDLKDKVAKLSNELGLPMKEIVEIMITEALKLKVKDKVGEKITKDKRANIAAQMADLKAQDEELEKKQKKYAKAA